MRVLLVIITLLCPAANAADFALHSGKRGVYSLDITGEIRPGDAETLAHIFAGKKRFPTTTRIGTQGGSLAEAMQLGQLFRTAHLSIMSSESCDLPCFTAFVGGISRAVSADLELESPAEPELDLEQYLREMGLSGELAAALASGNKPTKLSMASFDELVGESPVVFEDALTQQCGVQTPQEQNDFRSLQAARFVESLKIMQASTGREAELAPVIARYESLATHADQFSNEYRQRLFVQWQEIVDCRKHVLEQAQRNAIEQMIAQS